LKKYTKWIRIKQNNDFAIHDYKFYDAREDEIRL
jgi:hypothetical protein